MALHRLILIRHGESVGNEAASAAEAAGDETIDLPFRDVDTPLSGIGERQAAAVGDALRRLDVEHADVWSSPYRRAAETARRALDDAGIRRRARLDERLRDRELGVLDHLTSHGLGARYPAEAERRAHLGAFFYRPPGGESWADVALRLRSFLSDAGRTDAQTAVVVVHEAVVHLIRYVLEGWGERDVLDAAVRTPVRNASVTVLETTPDADRPWRATIIGDVSHLEGRDVPSTVHTGRRDALPRRHDIDPGRPQGASEESRASAE